MSVRVKLRERAGERGSRGEGELVDALAERGARVGPHEPDARAAARPVEDDHRIARTADFTTKIRQAVVAQSRYHIEG